MPPLYGSSWLGRTQRAGGALDITIDDQRSVEVQFSRYQKNILQE